MSIIDTLSKNHVTKEIFEPNEALKKSIAKHTKNPSDLIALKQFYRNLGKGFLMVAVDRSPPIDESGMVTETTTIKMLTSSGPNGGQVLLAFTDQEEVFKRIGNSHGGGVIAQRSVDVLKAALAAGHEGVIINAGGPWAGAPKETILEIIEGKYP